jgi:guanylate kinase
MHSPFEQIEHHIRLLSDPQLGVVTETPLPNVYKTPRPAPSVICERALHNNVVVLAGPSQVGKGSVLASLLEIEPRLRPVRTATNRIPRPGEPGDARVWMRAPRDGEDKLTYAQALVSEYDLVEHTAANGGIYGIPRQNLLSTHPDQVPTLDVDLSALTRIRQTMADTHRVLGLFICPPDAETIINRILQLGDTAPDRLHATQRYLETASGCADYIVVNPSGEDVRAAIDVTARTIHGLLSFAGVVPA